MSGLTGVLPGRAVPLVDEINRPFFDGAAVGVLRVQQCVESGRMQHYPRPCSVHTGGPVRWVDALGRGSVYSFTVIRQNHGAPAFHAQAPYVVALIDLAEGARVMGNILVREGDEVHIGDAVRVVFHCVDQDAAIHLPFWILSNAAVS